MWLLIGFGIAVVFGAVIIWSLCAMAAKLDQAEEDAYGVEKARRS
jgi:hypothetical protein